MIILSTNSGKPAVVDPSQIAAMVEYGDYTRILLKSSSHEVVVTQTIEEIAIQITEANNMMEREYKKMARGGITTGSTGPIARGKSILDDEITSVKIKDAMITTDKIKDGSIHFYSTDESGGKPPF